jgi:Flp pilus assembly protein protease CpaA
MFLALIVFSSYISIKDWQNQKITNKSLLFGLLGFLLLSIWQGEDLQLITLLICILITPLLIFAKVGAGDVKLLALLAIFFLPSTLITLINFLSAISVVSTVLLVIQGARDRSLGTSIAFGPAICGAVIWCAR